MKTNYRNFEITSVFIGKRQWSADKSNCNNHIVTVENMDTHKKVGFEYWGSIIEPQIKTKQQLLFSLHCFLSDGLSGYLNFSEFCSEFGYDEYDHEHYNLFKGCKELMERAKIIGINEDMAYDMVNDLCENYGC